MSDKEINLKYLKLKKDLKRIQTKLYNLDIEYLELSQFIGKTLMIDDEIFMKDALILLKDNNDNVINEINNIVIPKINNKL